FDQKPHGLKLEKLAEKKAEEEKETAALSDRLILFTTRTCPNCRMARTFLDKAGLAYEVVIADENEALCDQFRIAQAPTLVVIKDGQAENIENVSNIRKYIESIKATA
ncbi:MAG: thioredoxin family protein, partial [Clostridia bacterium]|nr:thioredoxin family protein [Clostridia bacterium]